MMNKKFISITVLLLSFTLISFGLFSGTNPYSVSEVKTVTGAVPHGSLVLDAQTELVMRNDRAYEPEKSNPIDLSDYKLVFNEEFEGDELDFSVWRITCPEGLPSRAGIVTNKYTRVKDGNLYMPIKQIDYEVNGEIIKTWAQDDIEVIQPFTYGYFECRAIMPKAHNGAGAFWLMTPGCLIDGEAPETGAEVDIIESQCYGGSHIGIYQNDPQVYEVNIHYIKGGKFNSLRAHGIKVPGVDMYEEFHTYGVLWTPQYYVFYVDGLPAYKTTFAVAGPAADEYVRLSTYVRGDNNKLASNAYVDNNDTDMVVDYVRIWQLDDPDDYPDFTTSKFMTAFNNLITRIYTFFDKVADFFRDLFKIKK